MMKRRGSLVWVLPVIFLAVMPVKAGTIAYADPADVGNQNYNLSLTEVFDVLAPIHVLALGVYDSGQDGFINTLTVAIFRSDNVQMTPVLSFRGAGDTLIGGDRFRNLASPVNLGVGRYSVSTFGWAADANGNAVNGGYTPPTLNGGGGLISFVGIGFGGNGLSYIDDGFAPDQFNAGSFEFAAGFAASSVPEPGSAIAVTLGLVACVLPRLRRGAAKR